MNNMNNSNNNNFTDNIKDVVHPTRPLAPFMPDNPRLAHAYVPYQVCPEYFDDPEEGWVSGTVFPELTTQYLCYQKREV